MDNEKQKIPTRYELREEIRKCNGNPDKLLALFDQYVAIYLIYLTDQVSLKLTEHKNNPPPDA